MKLLDNLRILLGFVAMLMAVVWYGSLYVGLDLPGVIAANVPFIPEVVTTDEPAARSANRNAEPANGGVMDMLTTHAVPVVLVIIAALALFMRRRSSNE